MNNLQIKVCGITQIRDARAAVRFGADWLGYIFYKKSPRYVSVRSALSIISSLPVIVSRVGVFVNEENEKILKIANRLQLDYIQLSGDEKIKDIRYFQKNGYKVIKTYRIHSSEEIIDLNKSTADIVHLDTADKLRYGGIGKPFQWKTSIKQSAKPIMLAGGINKDNVLEGIKRFQPLIVDVNSQVETKPGIKSTKKLKEFFKVVNKQRYEYKKTR